MNYVLFDGTERNQLLPLAYTRPVSAFRIGILTIYEKWELYLNTIIHHKTAAYLNAKYLFQPDFDKSTVWINGSICPTPGLVKEVKDLLPGQILSRNGIVIAIHSEKQNNNINPIQNHADYKEITSKELHLTKLNHLWDIFLNNSTELIADYKLLTNNRSSQPISTTNRLIRPENIFLEEGAQLEYTTLNASAGPIYIGKDAQIMENTAIRGPFALCEGAIVKLSAKIYGATTIGPYCTVGGEIKNSIIFGYSNKGHDGYLGNSVIGEWCNMGAGTSNSNLKNNYSTVKLWNYANQCYENSGEQFCGLFMADYSKCSINTMFNTGTVVGVNTNVFNTGFPEKFVADFTWRSNRGNEVYDLIKAIEAAEKIYQLKNKSFTNIEKDILTEIYKITRLK